MKPLKKRIKKKEIARQASISADFLSHILRGRKQCPPKVALRLEEATGIGREIWVWAGAKAIREAVENYIYREND